MREELEYKFVAITPPAAIVDNASFTTAAVDTKGWAHCKIVAQFGAMDIAMAALKVQESDDNGSSDDFDDVPNLNFNGSTNLDGSASALPSATDDNKFFVAEIPCGGNRKRYLDLVATGGDGTAGTYMSAFAILSRPKISPSTIAEHGCAQILMPNAPPVA